MRLPTGFASSTALSDLLARKFAKQMNFTPEIAALIDRLEIGRAEVPAHTELVVHGRPYENLGVLLQGAAMRHRLLPDGRRQIISFALPGDFIGLRGTLFEIAVNSVMTLERSVISRLDAKWILDNWAEYPMVGAMMYWTGAVELTLLAERVVSLGRRTARERIAQLLLELLVRLQEVGLADEKSYDFPLSHELIADAVGLSKVHVTRTLGSLQKEGLVELHRHRVEIRDVDALCRVADFEDSYLRRYRPWLFHGLQRRAG